VYPSKTSWRNTGWNLRIAEALGETPAPTAEELAVLRDFDREGFWTKA
jgi:hypothetical protein